MKYQRKTTDDAAAEAKARYLARKKEKAGKPLPKLEDD